MLVPERVISDGCDIIKDDQFSNIEIFAPVHPFGEATVDDAAINVTGGLRRPLAKFDRIFVGVEVPVDLPMYVAFIARLTVDGRGRAVRIRLRNIDGTGYECNQHRGRDKPTADVAQRIRTLKLVFRDISIPQSGLGVLDILFAIGRLVCQLNRYPE